ncbi:MAG: hypothetical protein IIV90_00955 [Oscillospiraceae bacterium]|nr:hypothetical protein [Oscillospiraceae bacterium]
MMRIMALSLLMNMAAGQKKAAPKAGREEYNAKKINVQFYYTSELAEK